TIGEWARDLGFTPLEAASGNEALDRLREQVVDVALLDLRLTNEDGMEVLKRLREEDPSLPVVMLTGHGSVEHAVQATKLGAYDFMLKPPDLNHLGVVVARAIEHARLQREVQHLRAGSLGEVSLIGESLALRRVLQRLDKVAKVRKSTTVLILGETGSGKELIARYLHAHSARGSEPFIALHCRAIPEELLGRQRCGHD